MKNTSGKIALLATTLFLSACVAGGHTSYSIEKMWADKTYLYIFYEKNAGFEAASLLNVHGGVNFSNKHYYYKKIERIALAENLEIDLADGVDAGNLKYIDEDFRLEEGGAFHPEKRYVTNRSGRVEVSCDENALSMEHRAVSLSMADEAVSRVGDRLFYCGVVISVADSAVQKVSDKIAEKLKILSGKMDSRYPLALEFSRSKQEGIILVRDMGRTQYLELDAASLEIKREGRFPLGPRYGSAWNGEYYERGFVNYGEVLGEAWMCDSVGCRKLRQSKNYRTLFAEAGNRVYVLESREGEGFWSSILKVKVLDVEGETGSPPQ